MSRLLYCLVSCLVAAVVAGGTQSRLPTVAWPEAEILIAQYTEDLPTQLQALRAAPAEQRADLWNAWVVARRQAISARVAQGDEDSIVNLLLFGTSFTAEPRITAGRLAELDRRWRAGDAAAERALRNSYQRRAEDLVNGIVRTGAGERLRFARRVLEHQGHTVTTAQGREAAVAALLSAVIRVREEAARLARTLEGLRETPDTAAAISERAQLFRERGLAPDSSVLTQYAVDAALCGLVVEDPASRHSLNRIAVIGPGLDFIDKQEGLDFYDPQSLQPFTVMDSLLRCDLAGEPKLRTTVLDINPRVTEHVRAAASGRRSGRKAPFRLVFPRVLADDWTEDATAYWRRAGTRIGVAAPIAVPPSLKGVAARAIQVRPALAAHVEAVEANIVYDRIEPAGDTLFDLIVVTNVLVYYDRFEQTLAVASLAAMLRPGGLLLTNTRLPDVPEVPLRPHSQRVVRYFSGMGDGEHMLWYRRVP